jgi:hypothetical protein
MDLTFKGKIQDIFYTLTIMSSSSHSVNYLKQEDDLRMSFRNEPRSVSFCIRKGQDHYGKLCPETSLTPTGHQEVECNKAAFHCKVLRAPIFRRMTQVVLMRPLEA